MKTRTKVEKPIIPLAEALWSSLIAYTLSDFMARSMIRKFEHFFDLVNTSIYEEDGDLEIYYRIIRRLNKIIIEEQVRDSELLIDRLINSPKDGDEILDVLERVLEEKSSMNSTTANYIENEIIDRINFINVTPLADKMRLTLSRLENQDYESFSEIVQGIQTDVNSLAKSIMSRASTALSMPDVAFGNVDTLAGAVRKVRNFINDDRRIIKTGIKRLDQFLGGGFQPGRVYLSNGISGGWKSGWLLNVAMWAVQYNDDMVCNDPSRRPCAVYVTQENDIEETMARIFSYIEVIDEKGKAKDEDEILDAMKHYKLTNGRWELRIIYRPKNSISTGDLDTLITEIESEGDLEVKIMIHDYVKRIKPNEVSGDLRIDLGEVANDYSIIAKQRKIPVVSANQLNREAYRTLNEVSKGDHAKTKVDQGKALDPSMISESQMLLENVDVAFGQHREATPDGQVFLTLKKFKDRGSKSVKLAAMDYFAHPFSENNGMRLIEDALLDKSLSIDSISARFGSTEIIDEDDPDYDDEFPDDKKKSPVSKGPRRGSVEEIE